MADHARITRTLIDVDPDVAIRISAPYTARDSHDEPVVIPWTMYLGHVVSISFEHRDALVVLRDALSAALSANPVGDGEA